MNKTIGAAEIDNLLEVEIGRNQELADGARADDEMPSKNLSMLLRRVTELSTREIENLVDELHRLRKKLEADGDRIQGDIARHSALSQGVMQLTTVIADNVKKLPQPTH
jgi:hypothetical protein